MSKEVIARLSSHGHRFEILVDSEKYAKFKNKEIDYALSQSNCIYSKILLKMSEALLIFNSARDTSFVLSLLRSLDC